jgi:hypothetical protein
MTDLVHTQPDARGERQLYRRRSTIIAGFIFAGLLTALGIVLAVGEAGHGFLPVVAPLCATLALALLVLMVMVWPHIVARDERLSVCNTFVSYEVPYAAIDELRQTRMGLLVRTIAGKSIPVTAYATGSAGRMLHHKEHADVVIRTVQNKMEFRRAGPNDDLPPVVRRVDVRNLLIALVAVAIAIGVAIGAANTYH